jgi:hypothetical protein
MYVNKFLPELKVKNDVEFTFNNCGGIKPISLNKISLIYPIKKQILNKRQLVKVLKIDKFQKKMTLIIPYRNRAEHLKIFLPKITNHLKNQMIDYEVIVVEQLDKKPFNKAKLMNIAAVNSRVDSEYFVFHDVDLIPENIDYRFCNHTQKLFHEIRDEDGSDYKKYKETVLGGAILVPREIFFAINGYSNEFWQWGREDDEFFIRHILKGFVPLYDENGRFYSLKHEPSIKKDFTGNVTQNKVILLENEKLLKQNKQNYSNLRRGLINQDDDGISTLTSYDINFTKVENEVKYIGVSFR